MTIKTSILVTKQGNIFENVKSGMIVHGCNAQGVMGSGIAKQIKEIFPSAYKVYLDAYKINNSLELGSISYTEIKPHETNHTVLINGTIKTEKPTASDLIIVNAVTQQFYGKDGKQYVDYDAVRNAFKEVNKLCLLKNIKDVHFPQIGAGLGGGDWNVISKIIEEELDRSINRTCWILLYDK